MPWFKLDLEAAEAAGEQQGAGDGSKAVSSRFLALHRAVPPTASS